MGVSIERITYKGPLSNADTRKPQVHTLQQSGTALHLRISFVICLCSLCSTQFLSINDHASTVNSHTQASLYSAVPSMHGLSGLFQELYLFSVQLNCSFLFWLTV